MITIGKKTVISSMIFFLCNSYSQVLTEQDIQRKRENIVQEMNLIKNDSLMKGVMGSNVSRINTFSIDTSSYYRNTNNVCKVNFRVDKKGNVDKIIADDFSQIPYIKDVLISSHEEPFFIDFYSRYLISGCEYSEYKSPIHLSKNEKANEAMNLLFGHIENYYGPSINNIVQENYANAMATIQLIIKFGPRDEVLNTLRKVSTLNDMQSTLWNLNGYFRIITGTSIKILLLPENLKRINQISQNDSEKMELLALEIANISAVYDISTLNANLQDYLYSVDNLNLIVAMKTYDLIKKSMPEIFTDEIAESKSVNSYVEVMPNKIIEKLRTNGQLGGIQKSFNELQSLKSEEEIKKARESLEKKIKDIIYKEIDNNKDFISWSFNHKRDLSKELLLEIDSYGFPEKRTENKRKISPEDLVSFALPELKIYKGLISNKIPITFYQGYKKIENKIEITSENERYKLRTKYR